MGQICRVTDARRDGRRTGRGVVLAGVVSASPTRILPYARALHRYYARGYVNLGETSSGKGYT